MVGVTSNTGEEESHATPRTPDELQRTLPSVPQPPISGPDADGEGVHEQGEGFVTSEV